MVVFICFLVKAGGRVPLFCNQPISDMLGGMHRFCSTLGSYSRIPEILCSVLVKISNQDFIPIIPVAVVESVAEGRGRGNVNQHLGE